LKRIIILCILNLFLFSCATYQYKPLKKNLNYFKLPDKPLTPEKLAYLSIKYNPELKVERAKYSIKKAILINSKLFENPIVSGDIQIPTGGTTIGSSTGFDTGLSWGINKIFTHSLYKKASNFIEKQYYYEIAWKEWLTAEKTKETAYEIIILKKQILKVKTLLKSISYHLKKAKEFSQKGLLTSDYIFTLQTQYSQVEKFLNDLKTKLIKTELTLKELIGVSPTEDLKITADIKNFENIKITEYPKIISNLIRNRPDIIALKQAYESNENLLHASIIEQIPDIGLSFTYSRDNGNLYTVTPGISISLPVFNHNQAKIKEFKAKREEIFYTYNQRIFKAETNIYKILKLIKENKKIIKILDSNISNFQIQLNILSDAIKIGEESILNYNEIKNKILEAQIKLLSAKANLIRLIIALELETGGTIK